MLWLTWGLGVLVELFHFADFVSRRVWLRCFEFAGSRSNRSGITALGDLRAADRYPVLPGIHLSSP